jgi:uncharacterized protein YkwD
MRRAPIAALLFALLVTIAGPPAPSRAAVSATEAESMLLGWVNAARADRGLVPLVGWSDLASIAGYRAGRMASQNVLSHTVAGSLSRQLAGEGVTWMRYGEVIAWSTAGWPVRSAEAIFRSWRGSPSHWALLMSSRFNYVGVGLALRSSNGRTYGSIVLTESPDHSGAISRLTGVSRRGNDVTWTWLGYDRPLQTHTAGLRDYDVQYRVDGGDWRLIRNDLASRSITIADRQSGHTYRLRIRATDRRGNVGAWSSPLSIAVP